MSVFLFSARRTREARKRVAKIRDGIDDVETEGLRTGGPALGNVFAWHRVEAAIGRGSKETDPFAGFLGVLRTIERDSGRGTRRRLHKRVAILADGNLACRCQQEGGADSRGRIALRNGGPLAEVV